MLKQYNRESQSIARAITAAPERILSRHGSKASVASFGPSSAVLGGAQGKLLNVQ
jgi:hypothetical protein